MGILIRFIVCIAFLLLAAPAQAQQGESLRLYEQKIKAGLVYNFLKFTSWPSEAFSKTGNKLNVCLFGGDSFDGYLYPLEGKTAQQYVIIVKNIDDINQTESCNLLFIHRDEESNLSRLLESLKGKAILTISDINDFASQGGMVELAKEHDKVSVYINREAAGAAGVVIQPRMLKLARAVTTRRG